MPVVREMAITYGGQAVPGTVAGANVTLSGVHKLTRERGSFALEFDILVDGAQSPAVLAAACLALESTFNTNRLALTVDLNGNNALTVDDSNRSGFDVTPSIEKVGDEDPPSRFDTNTSRMYRVTIDAGIPVLGTTNRLEFGYDVSFTGSRRTTVTVSGTYTATAGGASSSSNYASLIDARVATILATLGGSFELTDERYSPDDVDGNTTFQRTYKEILFEQADGVITHPAIVDPNLLITKRDVTDEGAGGGIPLAELDASYDSFVDVTIEPSLATAWESIALPLVIKQLEIVAAGTTAIVEVAPTFDYYRHTISATVRAQALAGGGVLKQTIETLDEVDFGKIIRPVWPSDNEVPSDEESSDPQPTPAHVYQAARVISRTVTTVTEEVRTSETGGAIRNSRSEASGGLVQPGLSLGFTFVGSRSELMTRSTKSVRKNRGIATLGPVIPVLERTLIETFRTVVDLSADSTKNLLGREGDPRKAGKVGGSPGSGGSGGRG